MTIVKSNVIADPAGGIVGPVDTTEQYGAHFTSRGWATPQDQINAGFAAYILPSNTADGYYEEDWDYGSVLASASIIVEASVATVSGSPTIQVDISTKQLVGDPWTTVTNTTSLTAANVRYVKVRVNFLATVNTDLAWLQALNVRIERQQRLVDFTQDLGAGRSSGTFDITGLTDLPAGTPALVIQTAMPIAAKGNATDEAEMDTISLAGYALNSTTIRVYWRATGIVVGTYAFAYMSS